LETDLYYPIKRYFTTLGYDVKSEVQGCDVTAVRGNELVIVELKLQFNVKLLHQALERQKLTSQVYVAVPMPKRLSSKEHTYNMEIARRLGIGLLMVAMDSPVRHVEAAVFPDGVKAETKAGARRKALLLNEAAGRTGDYNAGGSTKTMIYTVYREKAVKIACALAIVGRASATELIKWFGCDKRTNGILHRNFRDWFTNVSLGVYALSDKGVEFLRENKDNEVVAYYKKECEDKRGESPCV